MNAYYSMLIYLFIQFAELKIVQVKTYGISSTEESHLIKIRRPNWLYWNSVNDRFIQFRNKCLHWQPIV